MTMTNPTQSIISSRRRFIAGSSNLVLSAGAIALLSGTVLSGSAAAATATAAAGDLGILNVAIGLEYEGINAYAIALKSGLLKEAATKVANKFRDDHLKHNEALIGTLRKLGGTPVWTPTWPPCRRATPRPQPTWSISRS